MQITQSRLFGNIPKSDTSKDEWLTPPFIIDALGEFDLDPCSPTVRPWPTAKIHFTEEDDGLSKNWSGRVWMNPPYSQNKFWLRKLSSHGNGIALLFARTETQMFFDYVWNKAAAIFFLKNRITFHNVDGSPAKSGNAGAPSCLIAYGKENIEALEKTRLKGKLIYL